MVNQSYNTVIRLTKGLILYEEQLLIKFKKVAVISKPSDQWVANLELPVCLLRLVQLCTSQIEASTSPLGNPLDI